MVEYRRSTGAVYALKYHVVWCPKYRLKVLVGAVAQALRELLHEKAEQLHVTIAALEVMPDPVQMFISAPPTVVLKPKATGWYVFLMLVVPDPLPVPPSGLAQVGADMGLLRLLTLSDGTHIDNPRWLRQGLAELRRAQRRLARAEKGGQNRRDRRLILAKWHEHLALAFMMRNAHLSLSAHDAGLGLFNDFLCFKAVDAGCTVVQVNPRHTSQQCSGCGVLVPKALSVRVHACPHCHLELDRDVNAAINILALALQRPPGSGGQALT